MLNAGYTMLIAGLDISLKPQNLNHDRMRWDLTIKYIQIYSTVQINSAFEQLGAFSCQLNMPSTSTEMLRL